MDRPTNAPNGRLGTGSPTEDNKKILIVGWRTLQNDLIASFITKRAGIATQTHRECPALGTGGTDANPATLILIDTAHLDRDDLHQALLSPRGQVGPASIPALFNVDPTVGIEQEAFAAGVKGFFYTDDSCDTLLAGIAALFAGGYWIQREIMAKILLRDQGSNVSSNEVSNLLTPRETEVLKILATGACNDAISNRLSISPNTVKTHVARIFRKIEVENRLQAALWAARNF